MTPRYVIGVDVGGTFTDIFCFDETTGTVTTTKVPSTRGDQSRGFIEGIRRLVDNFSTISTVIHGTTVGTNALLERKGAPTGLITTAGFRDVLEMRRRDRPTTWGLKGSYVPIVPRDRRTEVAERTFADGEIGTPVDLDAVRREAESLHQAGCEALCVFFINGYANDANERQAVAAVRALWPNPHVTAATEIVPEIREFERLSTATLNAYLQPVVGSYLERLEAGLAGSGFVGSLLIVQSNGGVMAVDTAKRMPVRTALSGPAAGVMAGKAIARAAGFPNIITCDMGGTSFDVSLIAEGESTEAAQTAIEFGLVVRTPMIEISTIGAGGGSIARVDDGGLLQVGPDSAGSDPGPACYGLGGDRPTVTDANLVLGRINADRPIGGKLTRLDVEAARRAVTEHVGAPLGLTAEAAADAILRVANARMAGAIRLVSIERGHDPASFAAMPFGGGGALHTGALIKETGLRYALIPRYPGVTSALGCVVADLRQDRVSTVNSRLDALDVSALAATMRAAGDDLSATVRAAGVTLTGIDVHYELDALYLGQTHTVAVALTGAPDTWTRTTIADAFATSYKAAFGRLLDGVPLRIMNWRLIAIGRRPAFDMAAFAPPSQGSAEICRTGERSLWIDGGPQMVPVYDRHALPLASEIVGPALLEQPDTTIFIDPGLVGRVDAYGNLVLSRVGDSR